MIVTNCSIRNPIVLDHIPFAMRLILHAYYPGFHPLDGAALKWLLGHFLDAANSGSWDELITSSVTVQFPEGLRNAKVDTTNSQYTGLDRSNAEFTHGYEPEIGSLLDALVPADGIMCDIGANWGYFSLYLATRPGFQGHIHAFEPIPRTFGDLNNLITDIGAAKTVTCHNIALSNVDGQAHMTIPNHFSGMASLGNGENGITVKLTKLDTLNLPRVDFLKIDVEGHESEMIDGAKETIAAHQPYIIFEDWFNAQAVAAAGEKHVAKLLEAMGYEFFMPLWMGPTGQLYPMLMGDVANQKLTLAPFHYTHARGNLPGRANLMACHRSKIAQMTATLTAAS